MKRTATRLADGRELFYYDARDDTVRDAVDRRGSGRADPPGSGPGGGAADRDDAATGSPAVGPDTVRDAGAPGARVPGPAAPRGAAVGEPRPAPADRVGELRADPLLGDTVVIAAHRQGRTHLPPPDACPLCPSRPGRTTEIPDADYEVVVFENRFPALAGPDGGRCEVVCFTADHHGSAAALDDERAALVLDAWTDRTAELSARPGVAQVYCFENRGAEIGVTLAHPHGQIYAYPFVTPRTERALASVAAHRERTGGRNLFDDVVAREEADGRRVVLAGEHWTAFVPYAARWPYEVHLYPRRRVPDLTALGPAARAELPGVHRELLRRFDRLFGPDAPPTPYISGWHQAPVRHPLRSEFALHAELFTVRRAPGKLKFLAGSESGMNVFVNDVPPETAAERLREAASR
ncbi:galactose-1-phosphate uridylyltransferase [Streptomyces mobaraensis NBRC 13819 = DSM 40847]|uniref:Galactose-1-phosphate uridylyltransferase n=1 Tax=Streptomyces mobaraensis (strain ATCC 29032 / DSM 40847 / JCM 4168 / NBRC 13819 / NCIMB 11159 / IPCR 16-22) TaxID=1223523 RepID=M2ZWG7_STRM1|nr:galactose-1-phosphate uridylyltransferase [Streptomyces mobaraensis]EME97068.1 galactose-1-phosphate uridylyltransferase [Streptomyces mobaraensis NBRC 13819 = DSM 40847]